MRRVQAARRTTINGLYILRRVLGGDNKFYVNRGQRKETLGYMKRDAPHLYFVNVIFHIKVGWFNLKELIRYHTKL